MITLTLSTHEFAYLYRENHLVDGLTFLAIDEILGFMNDNDVDGDEWETYFADAMEYTAEEFVEEGYITSYDRATDKILDVLIEEKIIGYDAPEWGMKGDELMEKHKQAILDSGRVGEVVEALCEVPESFDVDVISLDNGNILTL